MNLNEKAIVHKVRKLCVILFSLDVFFFAISHVITYLALAAKRPGLVEIGIAQFLIHAFGIELGTFASFCYPLALSTFSLVGVFSCVLSKKKYRQAIFLISFTELAALTPSGFLQALNDILVFLFKMNLLGTLNPATRTLVLISLSAANVIIIWFYIEHTQKQKFGA